MRDEETGLLVPPRDAEALAAAIERLVRDPALGARLGAEGAAAVFPAYDADRLVRDIESLYLTLTHAAR